MDHSNKRDNSQVFNWWLWTILIICLTRFTFLVHYILSTFICFYLSILNIDIHFCTMDYRYIAEQYNTLCTQHRKFGCKTSVPLWTHERHPYLTLRGELCVSFVSYLEKSDRGISKAHCTYSISCSLSQTVLYNKLAYYSTVFRCNGLVNPFLRPVSTSIWHFSWRHFMISFSRLISYSCQVKKFPIIYARRTKANKYRQYSDHFITLSHTIIWKQLFLTYHHWKCHPHFPN